MNTIILAAGMGNRLKPHTNNLPKCLVSLSNKSILEWQLDILSKAGVSKTSIVVGYKKEMIIDLNDKRINKIFINKNYKNTNMVKSLLEGKELFNNDLIISYSDIIYSEEIYLKLINSKFKNAIIVDLEWLKLWSKRFLNPLYDAETLKYDSFNYLKEIGKKTNDFSDVMGQYIGLMKFDKKTLNLILKLDLDKKISKQMYMTDLINLLIKNVNIKVIPVKRGWIEIDTKEDLELYQNELITKKCKIYNLFK